MKKEKLQDAIGMVGDDLIREAEEKAKPSKAVRIRWIAVVAAMLSFVIVLGVVMRPTEPIVGDKKGESIALDVMDTENIYTDSGDFALVKAQYPVRCRNPYLDGENNSYDSYDKWDNERREYWAAYNERTPDISSFITNSIPAFLNDNGENVIYSPINVYMALALLGEVTEGNSRDQVLKALGSDSVESMRADANAIWKALHTDDGANKTILANSLWLREDSEYKKGTLDILSSEYYASSYRGKMGSDEYNGALQSWLNEQTDNMLTDQIKGIEMDENTMLALASTLLFNGKWSDEFNPELTEKGIFHSAKGDVNCEYMKQSDTGNLFVGESFTAVTRNFLDNGHMILVLPNEGVTPGELVKTEEFAEFVNCGGRDRSMAEYTDKPCWEKERHAIINLSMPKFDVSSQLDLTKGLSKMGISDITDENKADFSSITDERAFLTSMVHGARVMVDESGCKAASYVVTLCGATAAPLDEIDFIVDRPFVFIIGGYDGLPLYIGIVNSIK